MFFTQEKTDYLSKEVTISFSDMPVKDALRKLEGELEGLVFVYSPSSFNSDRKINLSFKKVALREVLAEIFKSDDLIFQARRHKVILKPKNPDRF
ncbi:STN domain-containing protein [Roseivirga misakiensis]|uniref:Secretin/TonB short N-terminal domain-containing protein n=1 Tax=Roseivirga misakiensis TaxID=1563681 RepID=A0A1E5T6M4_9BACT|nr:STN domain-containing protein [Roseivirga misakiensis]OEK07029.1 hypothetical protein BFP71_05060 [Roseivirga misakiensis]